jgi:hypothetical protein
MVVVTLTGGCSYIASSPPPARPMRFVSECSDSELPAYGDIYLAVNTGSVALAALSLAALFAAMAQNEVVPSWNPEPESDDRVPGLLITGVVATAATVGLAYSARHGLRSATACRRARFDLMTGAVPAWPPPPPPLWPPPPSPPPSPPSPSPPSP